MKLFFAILALYLLQVCHAGENQWATFLIENHTSKTIYLTDVAIYYGKWYRSGCKLCELKTVEQTIGPGSHAIINASGRLLSPTGTEGEFAIYDGRKSDKSTSQILHLYFSVPYLIGTDNSANMKQFSTLYPVEMYGGSIRGSELGLVNIRIYDKDAAEVRN